DVMCTECHTCQRMRLFMTSLPGDASALENVRAFSPPLPVIERRLHGQDVHPEQRHTHTTHTHTHTKHACAHTHTHTHTHTDSQETSMRSDTTHTPKGS